MTRVVGLDDLKQKFAKLPVDVGKKVLRRGASAGAKVTKNAVIGATPVQTGRLRRAAIIKFVREKSNDEQALYIVTFRQGKKQQQVKRGRGKNAKTVNLDAYYAKFVERGHRKRPRRSKGGASIGGRVPGLFFFAGALRSSSSKAISTMVSTMTAEIKKVMP